MTRADYTHIQVLLDRSGSMGPLVIETESGFAAFVEEQKAAPGHATLGLDEFDDRFDVVFAPVDIADAPPLKLVPRGMTALLDAMGRSITTTGAWLAALPEDERPGQVIFVVITDGLENHSREWTREKVFALVEKQTKRYGWTFRFLAANQDAIATGASLGVARGQTMTYSTAKTGETYAVLSANTTASRVAGQAVDFTDADRANVT
jgi:hypothetical protein